MSKKDTAEDKIAARYLKKLRSERDEHRCNRRHVADDADKKCEYWRNAHPISNGHAATELNGRCCRDEHEYCPVRQAGSLKQECYFLTEGRVTNGLPIRSR